LTGQTRGSNVNVQWMISVLWAPSWKLWVAVEVTACRGQGHTVAASLQAAQLVFFYTVLFMETKLVLVLC